MAIRAIRATVLVDGVVADAEAVVLAGIRRGVFVFHAHVSNKVELHFFKFFDSHSLPTINVVHFSQSVVDTTETATANRAIFLELTTGDAQQVAHRLDVISVE